MKIRDEGSTKFRFVAFVPGTETSKEFVEVFGGKKGHEKMRYIRPDRVLPITKPARRRRTAVAAS